MTGKLHITYLSTFRCFSTVRNKQSWDLYDVDVLEAASCLCDCKKSCQMVRDLISFAKCLQAELWKYELIKMLKPIFTLMGSVPEGTRIGLGNDTDIMMEFGGFGKQPPFHVVEDDPFHLYATDDIPTWMEKYLDEKKIFLFYKFMRDLLDIVSACIEVIFKEKRNPENLLRKTTNSEFNGDLLKCEDCKKRKDADLTSIFKQCKHCMVTVSQTKIGIGLQFLWKSLMFGEDIIYCSVDLVPTFNIKDIAPLNLARIVNTAMISI
jgi:hypothetical protein